jgi:hypothetical protein
MRGHGGLVLRRRGHWQVAIENWDILRAQRLDGQRIENTSHCVCTQLSMPGTVAWRCRFVEGGTSQASFLVELADSNESWALSASATHANWVVVAS